jgi:hypothetical protein
MHALLTHATRLALYPVHLALLGAWRPLLLAAAVAGAARLLKLGPSLGAGLAVLAGWMALDFPALAHWPEPPEARLAGLGVLVLADAALRERGKPGWWQLPVAAAAGAWWVRGAPLNGPGILNGMPVFLGLLAALPLGRRLTRGDAGTGTLAAGLALGGALWATGAALSWVKAALTVAAAALPLLGLADATAPLAAGLVLAAAMILSATNAGRFTMADAACLAPLIVWAASPALAPRLARSGLATAALLSATACVAVAWAVAHAR